MTQMETLQTLYRKLLCKGKKVPLIVKDYNNINFWVKWLNKPQYLDILGA